MERNKNKNIVLIGYMGSGKSTVGHKAAKALGYQFIDTDLLIEKDEGMTISKLFEVKGESYFREKETETIKRLIQDPKGNIVATGGGLPMKEGNPELLKELGTVIYLKAEPETLVKRLTGDTVRPLLKNCDIREKTETMLKLRGPVYEACADLVLQTDNMSFYEITNKIEQLVKEESR